MNGVFMRKGEETWRQRHQGECHLVIEAEDGVIEEGMPQFDDLPQKLRERYGTHSSLRVSEGAWPCGILSSGV